MTNNITKFLKNMSVDEMRARLAEYMKNDPELHSPFVAVEVRRNTDSHSSCRYDVLIIDKEGSETPVKFTDRYSRLIYIYTLLHPAGDQRRKVATDNYRALCRLYDLLYFKDSKALLETIGKTETAIPGHFMSHYIAQSRNAVRKAIPFAEKFIIDHPQSHNGNILIPFAAEGGIIKFDASLIKSIGNF